jgi:hypothetical protein
MCHKLCSFDKIIERRLGVLVQSQLGIIVSLVN